MKEETPGAAQADAPARLVLLARQHRFWVWCPLALVLVSWTFLAWTVLDMGHPLVQLMMPMSARWGVASAAAILAMWAIMMAAMMLPSALPMLLQFVDLARRNGEAARGWAFVGAYLLVWLVFSVAATALQWCLQAAGWTDPMAASRSAWLTAALLLLAGIYQFSPLKRVCLARCRSPIGFLLGEWRAGARGALVMGLRHGLFCLGCCWALMALLFVGGVMNLAWVAALAIAVAVEKMLPRGAQLAAVMGLVLIGAGVFKLLALLL
jgi:predicted metal-binding membrane protein